MLINLVWDAAALAAPQSFRDGMNAAAKILDTSSDNITINISVGYGTFQGAPNPGTEGQCVKQLISYSQLAANLTIGATSAADLTSLLWLSPPAGSSGGIYISTAQAKAFGLTNVVSELPGASGIDGWVGISLGLTGSTLINAGLHELTHAMGRVAGDSLDLFRYTAPGVLASSGTATHAALAYFSIDGGVTNLGYFGSWGDPGDFSDSLGLLPGDPFNTSIGTLDNLTPTDVKLLDVLGFHYNNTAPGAITNVVWQSVTNGATNDWVISNDGLSINNLTTTAMPGWVVVASGDFNNDGTPDIMWKNTTTGATQEWLMSPSPNGGVLPIVATPSMTGWNVVATGDFNHDGTTDILWQNTTTGATQEWLMSLSGSVLPGNPSTPLGTGWNVVATGNFPYDASTSDGSTPTFPSLDFILWKNAANGTTSEWMMSPNGGVLTSVSTPSAYGWNVAATGDFNHDGTTDIMWQNATNGTTSEWLMSPNGGLLSNPATPSAAGMKVVATGDFNGTGPTDIMWQNATTGATQEWLMSPYAAVGKTQITILPITTLPAMLGWNVVATGDFNGDGTTDILWKNATTGATQEWMMLRAGGILNTTQSDILNNSVATPSAAGWNVVATGDFNHDGTTDILWQNAYGTTSEWMMSPNGGVLSNPGTPTETGLQNIAFVSSLPAVLKATVDNGSTLVTAGHYVTIAINLNYPVTVNGTPTLQLNDGEVAGYTSGSGTNTLTFTYVVQAGDNVADLQVTGLNLPTGSSIVDGTGNSLAGPVTSDLGIQVQTTTGLPTSITQPAVAVEAIMYGATGTSAEITNLTNNFLPAQVANATANGLNPLVYACEAVGLVFAFGNENGSAAFSSNFGPSNSAMPNTTAGDAAFAAAASTTIFGTASTANLVNVMGGFVSFWKGFFTANGVPGATTAAQIDLAARGTAWGDMVGVSLANNLGPLSGQVTNFLNDVAKGTAVYGASLASQPANAALQGGAAAATTSDMASSVNVMGIASGVESVHLV